MWKLSFLLFIAPHLITCSFEFIPKQSIEEDAISYRLPNNTFPEHYNIHLTTNVHKNEFTFTGKVEITLTTTQESTEIVVHARQLTIGDVSLRYLLTSTEIGIDSVEYDATTEFLSINLNRAVGGGQRCLLTINYNGVLREDNLGFYRSSYRDVDNRLVWIAATQFAATNARHAFPCYDEPHIKATYEIHITHDPSYSALSNYPLFEVTENSDGSITSHFCACNVSRSLEFSTYIIGFVVAKFDYVSNIIEGNPNSSQIEYRVYARPEAINNTKYALSLVQELLNVIQETVKVDYVLPKLYQVALPDFYFNAMENWGLITYKEERLLFNENTSPYTNRVENSRTMAHEVAHKWFGNLVTHNWWSFVWFKEGFARFFEQYTFGKIRREWRIEDLFVLTDVQNVLFTDSLFTTRQMTLYKETPSDILALYDNVAYQKGGSFLRMLFNVFGETIFFRAVTQLLSTNSFRAIHELELYSAIATSANADYDVTDMLQSWTHQAGYPVVTVERNYEDGTFTLTQQKFNLMPEDDDQNDGASWTIPFTYITNSDNNVSPPIMANGYFFRNYSSLTVNQTNFSPTRWIILNYKQQGYYRVNYDENNWNLIISDLKGGSESTIPILNRAQLIDDAFNLARANKLSYIIPLRLIEYLKDETDYIPWMAAMNALQHINRFYVTSEYYKHFKSFLTDLIQSLHERVGLIDDPNEPVLSKYGRTLSINWACELELDWCKTFAMDKIHKYAVEGIPIEPNLRSAIYCAAIRIDQYYFSHLYSDMVATKDQTERKLIVNALGCSGYSTALENKLLTIFNNTDFRLQELTPFFTSVYSAGGSMGVLSLIRNFQFYIKTYSASEINQKLTGLSGIILGMAQRISTTELDEEFSALLEDMRARGVLSEATVTSAKKYMKMNSDWLKFSNKGIKDYLDGYYDVANGSFKPVISVCLLLLLLALIKFQLL